MPLSLEYGCAALHCPGMRVCSIGNDESRHLAQAHKYMWQSRSLQGRLPARKAEQQEVQSHALSFVQQEREAAIAAVQHFERGGTAAMQLEVVRDEGTVIRWTSLTTRRVGCLQ